MSRRLNFTGFLPEAFAFLDGLRLNNDKLWFEAHKAEYQRHVLEPMKNLVTDLAPLMSSIDPQMETRPAVNKTISRIQRDTRFSQDKTPYKTRQWFSFKRPSKEWQNFPAFYFELSLEGFLYGMGMYCADRPTMDRFRADVDRDAAAFRTAIAGLDLEKRFTLGGDRYQRSLKADLPPDLQPWYNRKSFYLIRQCPLPGDRIGPELVEQVAQDYQMTAPLYQYLTKVLAP